MTSYLQAGYYEAVLPVHVGEATGSLRVWLRAEEMVPLLRQLDARYGGADHPYWVHAAERLEVLHRLEELIRDRIIACPAVLKRVCTTSHLARELQIHYEVRRVAIYPPPPPWLDQVDLEPADVALLLGSIFHRQADAR